MCISYIFKIFQRSPGYKNCKNIGSGKKLLRWQTDTKSWHWCIAEKSNTTWWLAIYIYITGSHCKFVFWCGRLRADANRYQNCFFHCSLFKKWQNVHRNLRNCNMCKEESSIIHEKQPFSRQNTKGQQCFLLSSSKQSCISVTKSHLHKHLCVWTSPINPDQHVIYKVWLFAVQHIVVTVCMWKICSVCV